MRYFRLVLLAPLLFIGFTTFGQDANHVKDTLNYNIGFAIHGPKFALGQSLNNSHYHEISFIYQLFSTEPNENTVNNRISGGFYIGYEYFLNTLSESKFKYYLGTGMRKIKQESGSNIDPKVKGATYAFDIHSGLRYHLVDRLSINIWLGVPFFIERSNSLTPKRNFFDEGVQGSLNIQYRLSK